MTDISIRDAEGADQLLFALGEQLAVRGEHYNIAVVGGSALLALGLVARATRDVDIVALSDGHELISAEPLPDSLLDAAQTAARDFARRKLAERWAELPLDLGLPDGFHERAVRRDYGPGLEVAFASRVDQIHLKLYATVDQGAGKHLSDLEALEPSRQELLHAAAWE